MKIGIPQAMLYYDFNDFFTEFFKRLDIELIVSPKTNINILNKGIVNCIDEACLPVKIFHGHVINLMNSVDYIFVPRIITSYKKEYYCPKQLGLADMVRHSIDDIPNLIDPIMHIDSHSNTIKSLHSLGKLLGKDMKDIKIAAREAYGKLSYNKMKKNHKTKDENINLLITGHPYIVEDNFINMNIKSKLLNKANLIYTKDLDRKAIRKSVSNLKKRIFWTHGIEIVGSSYYAIDSDLIDGIIYLSSFGCGLDSVLVNLIEQKSNEKEIPLMIFNLDEQTGEAGFNTRLEAYLDMLNWRWRNESKLSSSR